MKLLSCTALGIVILVGLGSMGSGLHISSERVEATLPATGPDIIVSDVAFLNSGQTSWGRDGDTSAFGIATTSCNVGDAPANWDSSTAQHPIITQNVYRLKSGRFEQIGLAWVKHGFATETKDCLLCDANCDFCCNTSCIVPPLANTLGVNCRDTYNSTLNGDRSTLGPHSEVNAFTGEFPPTPRRPDKFCVGGIDDGAPCTLDQDCDSMACNYPVLGGRMQVLDADLDPASNPGASYYLEVQYLAQDDAASGNALNNAAYRPTDIGLQNGLFRFNAQDVTVPGKPAIFAWGKNDPQGLCDVALTPCVIDTDCPGVGEVCLPNRYCQASAMPCITTADCPDAGDTCVGVTETTIQIPGEGQFILAAKASPLRTAEWRYDYAIFNLNSDRSGAFFRVPVPTNQSNRNFFFHDVNYHSGEVYDLTDWVASEAGDAITWSAHACVGGDLPGAPCVDDVGCPNGGLCRPYQLDTCVGGDLAGARCIDHTDCDGATSGLCTGAQAKRCIAGDNIGASCFNDSECLNGGIGSCAVLFPSYNANVNGNALRFSTMYSYGFISPAPPAATTVTLGLFKPGTNDRATVSSVGPAVGPADCNGNSIPDECDIDCNAPGCTAIPLCGLSADCQPLGVAGHGIPDECEIAFSDCNGNAIPDNCDTDPSDPDGNGQVSGDCNNNDFPDECEQDCDGDGLPTACDRICNGIVDFGQPCFNDSECAAESLCIDNEDTDNDGLSDCDDLCPMTNPGGSCVCPDPDLCCLYGDPNSACIGIQSISECLSLPPFEPVCQLSGDCRDGCLLGDIDDNGRIELIDIAGFMRCFTAQSSVTGFLPPQAECARIYDMDNDGTIEQADYASFLQELVGP